MRLWANKPGLPCREYANISPTIHGTDETLPSQAPEHLTQRAPFPGCPAGHTFFHADPFGRASICKVGREPNIDLVAEGVEELADSAISPSPSCFAPEDAPAASYPARTGCAGRWPRFSRKRRHH